MAQSSYSTQGLPQLSNAKAVIIQSKWYREITDAMISKCLTILSSCGVSQVECHTVPGCLEIPLCARRLMQIDPAIEAVLVFGVILKGDTYHFDIVKDLCMSGLERVGFECDVPIINEILPVVTLEDAYKRSADNDSNKGLEAAIAAVEIIDWRRKHPLNS
jgi:6,7-dimethyl-8-ribityllumazine synthase